MQFSFLIWYHSFRIPHRHLQLYYMTILALWPLSVRQERNSHVWKITEGTTCYLQRMPCLSVQRIQLESRRPALKHSKRFFWPGVSMDQVVRIMGCSLDANSWGLRGMQGVNEIFLQTTVPHANAANPGWNVHYFARAYAILWHETMT